MRILHYSLGLARHRGGGLSKYANDLALFQAGQGHDVYYCWPGRLSSDREKVHVKEGPSVRGFTSCEVINPIPVPGVAGIRDVDLYCEARDVSEFDRFLCRVRPDIVHLHTLMGLPCELLTLVREAGIPIVFTVHDYFGICPRASLFNVYRGCNCGGTMRPADCHACCNGAFSLRQLTLQQSGAYRALKSNKAFTSAVRRAWRLASSLRGQSDTRDQAGPSVEVGTMCEGAANETVAYKRLFDYYEAEFGLVSLALYNSEQTKSVFERYGIGMPGRVIPVTHPGISDRRESREPQDGPLRIAYMSSCDTIKGLSVAMDAVRAAKGLGCDVVLNVYNDDVREEAGIVRRGSFTTEDLGRIFSENDCSITPSIWLETFSFTTLESLSFGVPAIVTDKVGARYLVERGGLGVVYDGSAGRLAEVLVRITHDRGIVSEMNRKILRCDYLPLSYGDHVSSILSAYGEVMG